jgi:hypothetical protein
MTNRQRHLTGFACAVLAGALALAAPATGDVFRTCAAEYVFRPSTPRLEEARSAPFSAVGRHASDDEAARRDARHRLEICALDHWASPHADAAPASCTGGAPRSAGIVGYPLTNLLGDASAAVCAANPGVEDIWIDIQIHVRGGAGCTPPPDLWAIDVGRGVRIQCAQPAMIVPVPRLERVPEQPRTIAPQPELRPAGSPPLPGVRMPGGDIRREWIGTSGWQACAGLCVETPSCRAWTWRAPGTSGPGSQAACWLKHTPGPQIADPCCHSGLRE